MKLLTITLVTFGAGVRIRVDVDLAAMARGANSTNHTRKMSTAGEPIGRWSDGYLANRPRTNENQRFGIEVEMKTLQVQGKSIPKAALPYFRSTCYGQTLQHASQAFEAHIDGSTQTNLVLELVSVPMPLAAKAGSKDIIWLLANMGKEVMSVNTAPKEKKWRHWLRDRFGCTEDMGEAWECWKYFCDLGDDGLLEQMAGSIFPSMTQVTTTLTAVGIQKLAISGALTGITSNGMRSADQMLPNKMAWENLKRSKNPQQDILNWLSNLPEQDDPDPHKGTHMLMKHSFEQFSWTYDAEAGKPVECERCDQNVYKVPDVRMGTHHTKANKLAPVFLRPLNKAFGPQVAFVLEERGNGNPSNAVAKFLNGMVDPEALRRTMISCLTVWQLTLPCETAQVTKGKGGKF